MKVKDIMKKVVTVDRKATIKEASALMSKKNIGCLIVTVKDLIVGIITERDILKHISHSNNLYAKVEDIMTPDVITISPNASLDEAADVMFQHKIKKLPVVDKGKLLGIITATDIIANADSIDEPFLF
ncbi:MAG: CBS domain-containing protein [Candidatus Pacearchaeota archaeon]